MNRRAVVAIPARDEAAEIGDCLGALAGQRGAPPLAGVVVCLNDCTDGSGDVLRVLAPGLPFPLHVTEVAFPPGEGSAGQARRIAMARAAALAGAEGVVLTTDADGRACPGWLAGNLAAIDAGADAVAGRATLDAAGAATIPAHLHEADALECAYAVLLDEIAARLDPEPWDPWPRHDEHCGASIAVTVRAFDRAGGMPAVPTGEDRAFFAALRRVDARIRHAPEVRVTVSARLDGRATGGMAETIRRRMACPDAFLDDRLEPARDAVRRASLRGMARIAWGAAGAEPGPALPAGLRLPRGTVIACLEEARWFGAAWARMEALSPVLRRRGRVAVADLRRETARAETVLRRLRAGDAAGMADVVGAVPRGVPVGRKEDRAKLGERQRLEPSEAA